MKYLGFCFIDIADNNATVVPPRWWDFFNEKNIYDIRVSNITIIREDRFKRSFLIFFQSYSVSNCSRIRFRVGNRDTFNLLKSILSRSNLLCPFTLRLFNRGWSSYYFRYSQFLLYIYYFFYLPLTLFFHECLRIDCKPLENSSSFISKRYNLFRMKRDRFKNPSRTDN